MEYTQLPADVVETDHQLENAAENASEALAQHRWHWTLDETNPDRVSLRAYAQAVGRHKETIREYARGYANWVTGDRQSPLGDVMKRVGMTAEREAIVEEVAAANEMTFQTARRHRTEDIARVRDAIEEATEREPNITPDRRQEIARRTATNIARSRQVERDSRERLRTMKPALAVMIEGELSKARYGLVGALNYAREIDPTTFPGEFLDQIQRSVADIDALVRLVRSAIGGAADIDWDAELRKLEVNG